MLLVWDNVRRSVLSQLNVSMWPLWETNGERHAVTVKLSVQPGVDLCLLNTASLFFYPNFIHFHPLFPSPPPPLYFFSFFFILSVFLFFCPFASVLQESWNSLNQGKDMWSSTFWECLCLWWETQHLLGGVRADWRCSHPGYPEVFRSVCFVRVFSVGIAELTVRWTTLFEKRNAVSQQTSVLMVKIPDRLNNVPGRWSGRKRWLI